MFKSKEDAIKFEDKLMEQFLVRGSRSEDYLEGFVKETYYYCDENLMENHKQEMLNSGWSVDELEGDKGVVFTDVETNEDWKYSKLTYKCDIEVW